MGWDKKPSEFMVQVKNDLTDMRREITTAALQGVVMASPVDTGAYRANHRVTVDSVTMEYDIEQTDKTGQQTIASGEAVIATINTAFGTITVQNNLPYAASLEHGHSAQAPAGVYGATFVTLVEKYR